MRMLAASFLMLHAHALTSPALVAKHVPAVAPRMTMASAGEVAQAEVEPAQVEDWSALDDWLAEGARARVRLTGPQQRPCWHATSAGHQRDSFEHRSAKMRKWASIGASERLQENLLRLGYLQPSAAQASAWQPISEGSNLLLADANGMGKTLAFVAPLVEKLWEWEQHEGRTPPGEVRVAMSTAGGVHLRPAHQGAPHVIPCLMRRCAP